MATNRRFDAHAPRTRHVRSVTPLASSALLAAALALAGAARADIIGSGDVVNDPTGGGTIVGDAVVSDPLVVGDTASGQLTIDSANGGSTLTTVAPVPSIIGNHATGDGRVVVDGGTWDNSAGSNLVVGGDGIARLEIRNGGSLLSNGDLLGLNPGSQGTGIVDGGYWSAPDFLTVGTSGAGSLTVKNGGVVSSGAMNVGINAGSDGSLVMQSGATLDAPFLTVGRFGLGGSIVEGAGTTVTLAGDPATGDGFLNVGREAGSFGSLLVQDGAHVDILESGFGDGAGFQAGRNAGAAGDILVFGAGSELNLAATDPFVAIGRSGTGSLTVDDNATVNVTGLNGVDYESNVGWLTGGDGTLQIWNGSSVNLQGELGAKATLDFGKFGGSHGALDVADAILNVDGTVNIGGDGTATAALDGGGVIHADVVNVNANGSVSGFGNIRADLARVDGGTWNKQGLLVVDDLGAKQLEVVNGGQISTGSLEVGRNAGASGTATVASGASVVASYSTVGRAGTGALEVAGSSTTVTLTGEPIFGDGFLTVGREGGSLGDVWVHDGARIDILPYLNDFVGSVGFQTARNAGSEGHILVEGAGSQINASGVAPFVAIGRSGPGSLTVRDGASVTATGLGGADYESNVGRNAGGVGTVEVYDGGTFTLAGGGVAGPTLNLGRDGGSHGELHVHDGGTAAVSGSINVGLGGTGTANVRSGGVIDTPFLYVNGGGVLGGDGTVTGAVVNQGGTVEPGNSPGTMTVGLFEQFDGTLHVEIAGPVLFDRLEVLDVAAFHGGSILFDFIGGYVPLVGDTFDFLVADGGIVLGDVTTMVMNLPSTLAATMSVVGGFGTSALRLAIVDPTGVPEPMTGVLVLAGAIAVGVRRRQRTRRVTSPAK